MNFIVSSTTLLRHLQSISGVLNTSNNLPILDNFLFDIENGQLKVSASDLETTLITTLEVQSEENGKIAVPAKMLLDMLKNLPEQPCTFLVKDNFQIEMAYDNGKLKTAGFDGEEFPKLPNIENKSSIKISGEILSSAIFTLLVRVDPPVTTVTASPRILRNSASNPTGAATIICVAIGPRFKTACSIRVRPFNWTSAFGIGAPNLSPLPAAGMSRATLGSTL